MIHTISTPSHIKAKVNTQSIWQKYIAYCDSQENHRFFWFALALFIVPCVFMPLSLYIIFQYSWYTYLIMPYTALLFANILTNVVQLPTRISISVFFVTILFNVLVPAIALLT